MTVKLVQMFLANISNTVRKEWEERSHIESNDKVVVKILILYIKD